MKRFRKFVCIVSIIVMSVILSITMGITASAMETEVRGEQEVLYEETRITEEADLEAEEAENEVWAWLIIIWMASWIFIPTGPILVDAIEDIVEKRRKKNTTPKISLEK